jgi:hypothetical protein
MEGASSRQDLARSAAERIYYEYYHWTPLALIAVDRSHGMKVFDDGFIYKQLHQLQVMSKI